jgi:hypothetical protein
VAGNTVGKADLLQAQGSKTPGQSGRGASEAMLSFQAAK